LLLEESANRGLVLDHQHRALCHVAKLAPPPRLKQMSFLEKP